MTDRLKHIVVGALVVLSLVQDEALAHPVGFGLLTVKHVQGELYSVTLRAESEAMGVKLPPTCTAAQEADVHFEKGSVTRRWLVRCPESLTGSIGVTGLSGNQTVWFRGELDGSAQQRPLTSDAPTIEVGGSVLKRYFALGMQHISSGWDHLAFLLCLVVLLLTGQVKDRRSLGRVAWAVTSFTLGHALTILFGSLWGWTLNIIAVELLIALSVVLMAREALLQRRTLTSRYPELICFGFGLLHGLGFADALSDIGLPSSKAVALLGFNFGVELAQLVFVAAILLCAYVSRYLGTQRDLAPKLACTICGALGCYWCIERCLLYVSAL